MNSFKPFVVKGFYPKELIELLKLQVSNMKADDFADVDNSVFYRKQVHNHPLFQALHHLMVDRVSKILNRPLVASYVFTSMYFEGAGECPKHVDRPQCQYTVDLCIDQREIWPFFAETEPGNPQSVQKFELEPGDALILSGTEHPHWREKIQPGNYCDLAFFHFVNPDFQGDLS